AQTLALLDQWLQRSHRDFFVDLRGKVPACDSDEACNPIPVGQRPPTDFLWQRDPFQLFGGGSGTIENAGIDYILPYWMARFYSIENGNFVISSAGGSPNVSTDSIGSFFGSNLASAIASANGALPESLGGISLQIRDGRGVSRLVPL